MFARQFVKGRGITQVNVEYNHPERGWQPVRTVWKSGKTDAANPDKT